MKSTPCDSWHRSRAATARSCSRLLHLRRRRPAGRAPRGELPFQLGNVRLRGGPVVVESGGEQRGAHSLSPSRSLWRSGTWESSSGVSGRSREASRSDSTTRSFRAISLRPTSNAWKDRRSSSDGVGHSRPMSGPLFATSTLQFPNPDEAPPSYPTPPRPGHNKPLEFPRSHDPALGPPAGRQSPASVGTGRGRAEPVTPVR